MFNTRKPIGAQQSRKAWWATCVGGLAIAASVSACSSTGPATGPTVSATPPTAAPTESASPVQTRFAGGQSSAIDDSPSSQGAGTGSGFDWSDPNGYRFHISVSFGTPGTADPIPNCTGGDAPPDTVNIPFTMTVTNLLRDRATALPALKQDLAGTAPNPHPAGASASVSETDGTSCGSSLYEIQGQEQSSGAIAAGGSLAVQGIAYAVPTPVRGAMTFTSVFNSATPVASVPLPAR